jgi:hypothetical protein
MKIIIVPICSRQKKLKIYRFDRLSQHLKTQKKIAKLKQHKFVMIFEISWLDFINFVNG